MDDGERGKLFVGGLTSSTTKEILQEYFEQYGRVIDCVVMKNSATGRARGFGFVTFADAYNVHSVLQTGPHVLDGRIIDPKQCNRHHYQRPTANVRTDVYPKVFVGGLPENITETDLRVFFGQYGRVMDVSIMYDHINKKSRGFGFLSFENSASVDRLTSQRHFLFNGKQIEIKRAAQRGQSQCAIAALPMTTQSSSAQITAPAVTNYQAYYATPPPAAPVLTNYQAYYTSPPPLPALTNYPAYYASPPSAAPALTSYQAYYASPPSAAPALTNYQAYYASPPPVLGSLTNARPPSTTYTTYQEWETIQTYVQHPISLRSNRYSATQMPVRFFDNITTIATTTNYNGSWNAAQGLNSISTNAAHKAKGNAKRKMPYMRVQGDSFPQRTLKTLKSTGSYSRSARVGPMEPIKPTEGQMESSLSDGNFNIGCANGNGQPSV